MKARSEYNHILLSLNINTSTFVLYYFIISNYYKHIMYMRAVHVVSPMLVRVHRLLWWSIHYNVHTFPDSNFIKSTFLDKFLPTWNHACLLTNKYTMHVIVDKTRQFLSQNLWWPSGGKINAFVFFYQHNCHDVGCKPVILIP